MKVVKAVAKALGVSGLFFVAINTLYLVLYILVYILLNNPVPNLHLYVLARYMILATPAVFIIVLVTSMRKEQSDTDKETE